MTQEEIRKAAYKYQDKIIDAEIDDGEVFSGSNYEGGRRSALIDYGDEIFVAGASWRINSVWHKMSEEPKRNCMLVLHGYGKTVTFNWNGDIKWKDIGKFFRAEEWAYIEDFLPSKEDE